MIRDLSANRDQKRAVKQDFGAIAQLGERYNGIVEVSGSIPLSSTISLMKKLSNNTPTKSVSKPRRDNDPRQASRTFVPQQGQVETFSKAWRCCNTASGDLTERSLSQVDACWGDRVTLAIHFKSLVSSFGGPTTRHIISTGFQSKASKSIGVSKTAKRTLVRVRSS